MADLNISRLTLGTVQLGMPYGIANKSGKPDERVAFDMLRRAGEGGVTCLDTAHAYGESEQVIGRYYGDGPRPTIVTKLQLLLDPDATEAEAERTMNGQLEESLSRLATEHVPIVLLHNPAVLLRHGAAIRRTFLRMKEEGRIGRAGVSFGADIDDQLRELWPIVEDELFEAVQVPINILDHRLLRNGGLAKFRESGKIVFARSVFLQGLVFLRDEELPAHLSAAAGPLRALRDIAAGAGQSIEQLAVSFVRDLPEVDSLVIGAETSEQLEGILRVMDGPKVPGAVRDELLDRLADTPEAVVNTVFWTKK